MKITKRQLRQIIREAARNEGWFLMAPDGTLAKSSQLNKPIWWPSESRAQQAYDFGHHGAEGAKPVAITLVLDDYGYNGYGPDPQDLQRARESRGIMGESIDYSFQNWYEYGFTDANNGDPPNPPDRPLETRDAYEDG